MPRKTVEIEFLRDRANDILANTSDEMVEVRKGVSALLESALFETHNYQGFMYLPSEWDFEKNSLRDGMDETRRVYCA